MERKPVVSQSSKRCEGVELDCLGKEKYGRLYIVTKIDGGVEYVIIYFVCM